MSKLPKETYYRICDSPHCHKCRPKPEMVKFGHYYFCSTQCAIKEEFNEVFKKENSE